MLKMSLLIVYYSGYRLAAVYSLYYNGVGEPPSASQNDDINQAIQNALEGWTRNSLSKDDSMLLLFLDNVYKRKELESKGVSGLKGNDLRSVQQLVAANSRLPPGHQVSYYLANVIQRKEFWGDGDEFTATSEWTLESTDISIKGWMTKEGEPLFTDGNLNVRILYLTSRIEVSPLDFIPVLQTRFQLT